MSREKEVFAINASNSNFEVPNRWVVYGELDNYEVYLETTKNSHVAKVHAATFGGQDQALEFIMKMDQLCTNGNPCGANHYIPRYDFLAASCKA